MPALDAADLQVLGELDEMRSELRTHLRSKPHWEGQLRRSLFAAAIQGSNTIENITISGSDARALVEHAPMSAETSVETVSAGEVAGPLPHRRHLRDECRPPGT